MPKYTCNWTLKRNGKKHLAGAVVELSEKEATPLLASGVISCATCGVLTEQDQADLKQLGETLDQAGVKLEPEAGVSAPAKPPKTGKK